MQYTMDKYKATITLVAKIMQYCNNKHFIILFTRNNLMSSQLLISQLKKTLIYRIN